MVNKRGFIRIVEAFFAILLILGFLLFLMPRQQKQAGERDTIKTIMSQIESKISENETLRQKVLQIEVESVKESVKNLVPVNLEFEIKLCEIDNLCPLGIFKNEVFAHEFIVSSTLQQYSPKKVKIFLWRKEI